jgi:hypothetical protein
MHIRFAPKAVIVCVHSRRQLLANARHSGLAYRGIAVRQVEGREVTVTPWSPTIIA